MKENNTFGERLVEARKMRNLSQEQLGINVGIDKRLLSRYETNKTLPSIEVAKKLATALQVSLDFLTGLDYSLFIKDVEMIRLIQDYEQMEEEDKGFIKKVLRSFRIASQLEKTQRKITS